MSLGIEDTEALARTVRADILKMVHKAHASHVGSCLSIADILAVLYGRILNVRPAEPAWSNRDRFVLSKGHAAAALYAVLARCGFFPHDVLASFCEDGSSLTGHISHTVPGVEVSTGSLGHGLPIGLGMAVAAHRGDSPARVFVLLSDGECDEGAVWEAAMFAGHHGISNLTVIVDYNRLQSFGRVADVLDLEPLREKWRAFKWGVRELDGHDHPALAQALSDVPFEANRPSVLLCHTVKGKGVSFMEDRLEWHYKSPDDSQLARALAEVSGE
jgi:transketolase